MKCNFCKHELINNSDTYGLGFMGESFNCQTCHVDYIYRRDKIYVHKLDVQIYYVNNTKYNFVIMNLANSKTLIDIVSKGSINFDHINPEINPKDIETWCDRLTNLTAFY